MIFCFSSINHLFFVKVRGFIEAGKLFIGDKLVSVEGKDLIVEAIEIEEVDEPVTVYNFKVEDYHTYFVGENAVWMHNADNYGNTPKTGKPGSPSWKKAVKSLKEARGKGNNFVTENKADAIKLIEEAKPDLKQCPKYDPNAPRSNYQVHPGEKGYNYDRPHIKFEDWSNGKQNGCNGHIFWEVD